MVGKETYQINMCLDCKTIISEIEIHIDVYDPLKWSILFNCCGTVVRLEYLSSHKLIARIELSNVDKNP